MDANDAYNEGLNLMKSIEAPLREGTLDAGQQKIAKEAEATFEKAIQIASNHGRAHIMLGMLLRFLKRGGEAIDHLKTGMELPRDSQDWLIACDTLAAAYMDLERYADAAKIAEKATKHHPDDPLGWWKLGASLYFLKKYEESRKVLEAGLQKCPRHAGMAGSLSEVLAVLEPVKPQEIPKEYADKQKQTEAWSKELQDECARLFQGTASQEEKMKKMQLLQAEFQEKVQKLYGG
jgi:tetratricopeptide (TPR) repeat protein